MQSGTRVPVLVPPPLSMGDAAGAAAGGGAQPTGTRLILSQLLPIEGFHSPVLPTGLWHL